MIAEMAFHLDGLIVLNHLPDVLASDADDSLSYPLPAAVTVPGRRNGIVNLQAKIAQQIFQKLLRLMPWSSSFVTESIFESFSSRASITLSSVKGIS